MMNALNQQIQELQRKLEEKGGGWKEPPPSGRPEAIVTGFPRDTPAKSMTDKISKILTELGSRKVGVVLGKQGPGVVRFSALQNSA